MLIKLVVYLVVEIITTIVCTSTGLVVYFSILFSELHFVHLVVFVCAQMYRIKCNNIYIYIYCYNDIGLISFSQRVRSMVCNIYTRRKNINNTKIILFYLTYIIFVDRIGGGGAGTSIFLYFESTLSIFIGTWG